MKNKILVSISGWGSDQNIFAELLRQCPELQNYQHIPLPWQNFVVGDDPGQLLLSELRKQLQSPEELEYSDILLLGWSLGAILCLQFSLHLKHLNLQLKTPLDGKPKIALILLAPTAAMCAPSTPPNSQVQNVKPVVLKLMQRKLGQDAKQVLLDFAHNCQSATPSNDFISRYLDQANALLDSEPHSLHAGLEYLIHCNLREALSTDKPISLPFLLAGGLHDKIIPISQTLELARLLPCAELLQVETGHNLLLPPPPELLKAISKFLKRVH